MKEYIEKWWNSAGSKKSGRDRRKKTQKTAQPFWRKMFPGQEEGQDRESYMRQNLILSVKYGVFVLAAFAVLRGILVVAGESVTVSNSVDGRELPIYCVETTEKKIALSFDAAWGNEDTAKILEILKKHDIHVTFFMTGGWVESYPEDVKAILAAGD